MVDSKPSSSPTPRRRSTPSNPPMPRRFGAGVAPLLLSLLLGSSVGACQSLEFGGDAGTGGGGGDPGPVDLESSTSSSEGTGGGDPTSMVAEAPIGAITSPPGHGTTPDFVEQCALPGPGQTIPLFESTHALPAMRSTASAAWAQAMLDAGRLPEASLLRSGEFLGYFASAHDGFEARLEVDVAATGSGDAVELTLRHFSAVEEREALRLVILVDVSNSMQHALPVVRAVFGELSDQLREGDHVGVVGFAGTAQVLAPLEPADASVRTSVADLVISTTKGADLSAGLAAAFGLGGEQPVHVLLLSDGGFEPNSATRELVESRRKQGHQLSVMLTGKPLRDDAGGTNPLSFHRSSAELLSSTGGGALLYAADVEQVARVLGGGGVGRALGIAGRTQGLRLSLPEYFLLSLPEADAATFVEQTYAPGAIHSVRLNGTFCNPSLLEAQGLAPFVATASLGLLDALGNPTKLVNPFEKFTGLPSLDERVERAVLEVFVALRHPEQAAHRTQAVATVGSLVGELACGENDLEVPCRSLAELEAMLASLATVVGG
jgi:hypothetical protein